MIELYQAESCPWCSKVRKKLTELGISYVSHNPRHTSKSGGDIINQLSYDSMMALGGEDQIPFLVDNTTGISLYESSDITEYLDKNYA
jgi:glutathione S-transferase